MVNTGRAMGGITLRLAEDSLAGRGAEVVGGGLGAVAGSDLVVDVRHVPLDGVHARRERARATSLLLAPCATTSLYRAKTRRHADDL